MKIHCESAKLSLHEELAQSGPKTTLLPQEKNILPDPALLVSCKAILWQEWTIIKQYNTQMPDYLLEIVSGLILVRSELMLNGHINQEDGFTLIELLVTIAVLAMLFGIVTIALGGVGSDTQDEVCAAEYHMVQSAIDIYLVDNPGSTLTAGTNTTISEDDGQFADYLRGTTDGLYSWTEGGVLSAGTCPAPASSPPWGCGSGP